MSLPIVQDTPAGGVRHLKPPVDDHALSHRDFRERPDWRRIPAYKDVSEEQFLDHHWQAKKSITRSCNGVVK